MQAADLMTLVSYNNWANGRLLAAAATLPPDQLMANAALSNGSAFETLRHMLDVEWSWRLACNNETASELLWKLEPLEDLPAVAAYWRAEGERLLAFVQTQSEKSLSREVRPDWATRSHSIQQIVLHILYHASNHRGEVGRYFHNVGHSPGDLEFLDYVHMSRTTQGGTN